MKFKAGDRIKVKLSSSAFYDRTGIVVNCQPHLDQYVISFEKSINYLFGESELAFESKVYEVMWKSRNVRSMV